MKRLLACVAGAVVLLASCAALACGAPFGAGVEVDPHQDIIVAWKDNVETYVFQPIFCGTATDFGLLLPVPALLTQNPALSDQEAFTKVAALSEPEKVQVTQHNSIGCAAGGSESKSGTIDNGTSVVASGRVGFLEWKQLKAETVASFTDWLTTNGYPYTSAASSVFSYYVGKSWYFLAFRISQQAAPSGGTICQALGPVAFSFPTTVPVVPSGKIATVSPARSGHGGRRRHHGLRATVLLANLRHYPRRRATGILRGLLRRPRVVVFGRHRRRGCPRAGGARRGGGPPDSPDPRVFRRVHGGR